MSKFYYYNHAGSLNRELKKAIPPATLKALHHKQAWRHLWVAARQLALLIILPLIIHLFQHPLIWVPASILMGFVIFSFTVLLHEAVHKCIFQKDRPRLTRYLGHLYGTIPGLSYSQFKRWHTDHHNQLGSEHDDPKRANLSPKRNARWLKALYFTPALFLIYTKASGHEMKKYPEELQKRIRLEKAISIIFALSVIIGLWMVSPMLAVKAWIIPHFFVFPMAFFLNRIGQHYLINPDDVANWSTLMRPNPVWNFLFLWSSYHLEHHYFPAVPFYKLKSLQKELDPFFEKRGVPTYGYGQLLKAWFVDNHQAHTRYESPQQTTQPSAQAPHPS